MKQRIISLIAVLAMIATLPFTAIADTVEISDAHAFRRGDVDGDGRVEISDALAILRYCIGLSSPIDDCERAKNAATIVNPGSGKPEIGDALQILRYVISLSNIVPPPSRVPETRIEDTRLYALNEIIESGEHTFIIRDELFGTVSRYVSAGRTRYEAFGVTTLGIEGITYTYNAMLDVWYYEPDTDEEFFGDFTEELKNSVLLDVGTADFNGQNLHFEEFFDAGEIWRYFFDGSDLAGVQHEGENLSMTIAAGVPADVDFSVPANAVTIEEFDNLLRQHIGLPPHGSQNGSQNDSDIRLENTRLFAIHENILSGEHTITTTIQDEFLGTQTTFRRENLVRIESESGIFLQLEDRVYIYNRDLSVWYFEDGYFFYEPEDGIYDLVLLDTGTAVFGGGVFYFEEFYEPDFEFPEEGGQIFRYFFHNNTLIGLMSMNNTDPLFGTEVTVTAEAGTPNVFNAPADAISYNDYQNLLRQWN
jgi:hypothetical protein